jgi:hypothetical protein
MTNKVRYVHAKYNTTLCWDLDDIAKKNKFNVEDIVKVDVGKWTNLEISLKDGRTFYEDMVWEMNGDETDWKWATGQSFYDKDYGDLDEDYFEYLTEENDE